MYADIVKVFINITKSSLCLFETNFFMRLFFLWYVNIYISYAENNNYYSEEADRDTKSKRKQH